MASPSTVLNKSMMWSQTPMEKRLPNVSWSEDAIIRIYDSGKTDKESLLKNSGVSYVDFVAYILYYDTKANMTYVKDVREDVLYAIPSGAKAKGYTLAFKLNLNYKEKTE